MADTPDIRTGGDSFPGDAASGAPRPSQTGTVPVLGFDDPGLRPLPPDRLDYHVPHPDAHPERHEHSDVPIRPLVISLVAIAVLLSLTFWFLHALFFHYKSQQEALEVKRTNVPDAKPPITRPRLQGVPGFNDKPSSVEMKDLREAYREELETYGKAPPGFARVPIDRAMDMALEKGIFKTAQQSGPEGDGKAPGNAAGPAPRPQSPPREQGVR